MMKSRRERGREVDKRGGKPMDEVIGVWLEKSKSKMKGHRDRTPLELGSENVVKYEGLKDDEGG